MKKFLRKRNGIYYAVLRVKPTDRPTEQSLHTRDKEIAEKLLRDMAQQMEREAHNVGIPARVVEAAQLPLLKHLEIYLGEKEKDWKSEKHYQLSRDRLKKLIRECGWKKLSDVDAFSFTQWRSRQSDSAKTLNDYLSALNRFMGWIAENRFREDNPIRNIQRRKVIGRAFERKALGSEEITNLLAGVKDKMRLAVYTTAIYTGLRRTELEKIQWGDVHLDAEPPYILARAVTTKNGKDAIIPLHPAVIDAILSVSKDNPSLAETVFDVPSIETFKLDLEAAGIPYKDDRGHKTDFHALRTTFCTMMHGAGVLPRMAQELMRHSDIKLTMRNYTDTRLLPLNNSIQSLPNFAIPTATPNPTLAGIGCLEQSEKVEGKTFKAPNNKGLYEVASPLVSQGERWCRGRDSLPPVISPLWLVSGILIRSRPISVFSATLVTFPARPVITKAMIPFVLTVSRGRCRKRVFTRR